MDGRKNLAGQLVQAILSSCHKDQAVTLPVEFLRQSPSNAGTGTGYENSFQLLPLLKLELCDAPKMCCFVVQVGTQNSVQWKNTMSKQIRSSLERMFFVARLLASYDHRGLTVSELCSRTELPMTTVHRLLGEMAKLRLVSRLEEQNRYVLGPAMFELGLAAAARHDLQDATQDLLSKLSRTTGMPAYFFGRSEMESVCLGFVEPHAHGSAITLKLGGRRPLGVGAAGLAILASLDDRAVQCAVARCSNELGKYGGLTATRLFELVAETRGLGYAASGGCINNNTAAVGVAVFDAMQRVRGAVSLSSTVARLRKAEVRQLAGCIQAALRSSALVIRLNAVGC